MKSLKHFAVAFVVLRRNFPGPGPGWASDSLR